MDIVGSLLENRADVSFAGRNGMTVLQIAAGKSHVQMLLNNEGKMAMMNLARDKDQLEVNLSTLNFTLYRTGAGYETNMRPAHYVLRFFFLRI